MIAPGSDADIVLIDPEKESVISAATHAYNTDNNPFEGFELKCGIDKVFLRGNSLQLMMANWFRKNWENTFSEVKNKSDRMGIEYEKFNR